jgi:hypothetical protein
VPIGTCIHAIVDDNIRLLELQNCGLKDVGGTPVIAGSCIKPITHDGPKLPNVEPTRALIAQLYCVFQFKKFTNAGAKTIPVVFFVPIKALVLISLNSH